MGRDEAFMRFPKATIGLVIYPGMFLQDLVGPLAVFEALMNREIHLLWKTRGTVDDMQADTPTLVPITATTAFDACPSRLNVLFVPGGMPAKLAMMEAPQMLAFLQHVAPNSRFVTSVCTSSFILCAAGLLEGYRAASDWAVADLLRDWGAVPSNERVCIDRNRITSGGVTAGIDFGLYLAARLTSPRDANAVQLYEYAPAPPYDAGRPETAPTKVRAFVGDRYAGLRESLRQVAGRAHDAD